ncbi:MAG: family 10 glycosylhydrolase [Clostridia bacterium]|nr:family 10 glycosylhydrolase [Clostridia bacterium]
MKNGTFFLRLLALALCAVVSANAFLPQANTASASNEELRGIWVSTVSNIDYPSKPTTNAKTLKNELLTIFDNCQSMGLNAVFFQVRPAGDALYQSEIFPWSRYLTGTQGKAPENGFDPLAFAVEEAHKRGLQLHAWINPYRITASKSDADSLSKTNPAVLHPEMVLTDSDGKMYYNPADSKVVELIVDGAVEIVKNYAVDGLHMDDYFYPSAEFNDDGTYAFYQEEYPDKNEWRRAMVNRLVETMDKELHAANPNIQFGISPMGIWANDTEHPDGSATGGKGSYSSIWADSRAWVKNGWVDYIMPQIYWNIGYEIADYSVLTDWWSETVSGTDVKLYIGEAAYKTMAENQPAWNGDSGTQELKQHIQLSRANDSIDGYCMFTYHTFIDNPAIFTMLKEMNTPAPPPLSGGENTEDKPAENRFTDMDDYWWAMDAVNALAEQGIIRGRNETEFDPDSFITRADNTVLLLRVLGKTATFEQNFADVPKSAYYYQEIGMAKALGIAGGIGDNKFSPETYIKRQDMATLAYRVLQGENALTAIPNTAVLNQFKDKDKIDFYSRDAMAACVSAGLMGGYGDGTINPQGNASRIEVAIFMHRVQKLLIETRNLTE